MQVVNNTFKWSGNFPVDFFVTLALASKLNCVYCSFSLRKIQCLFVWLFFLVEYFYLSSVGELLLQKNCPRSNNKKDDYGVKNKSSNVTLSWIRKCYSRFPSSYFFLPMSKKEVENRSSHGRRTLAGFLINLRKPSEYG